jgi:hypothetical protein
LRERFVEVAHDERLSGEQKRDALKVLAEMSRASGQGQFYVAVDHDLEPNDEVANALARADAVPVSREEAERLGWRIESGGSHGVWTAKRDGRLVCSFHSEGDLLLQIGWFA